MCDSKFRNIFDIQLLLWSRCLVVNYNNNNNNKNVAVLKAISFMLRTVRAVGSSTPTSPHAKWEEESKQESLDIVNSPALIKLKKKKKVKLQAAHNQDQ